MTPQPTEALRNGQVPTQKSSTDQYGRPIAVSSLLTPSPQPINVPTPVSSPIPDLESIISGFSQPTQTEQDQGTLQSEILKSLDTLGGKKGRQAELEKEAGLGTQRQSLQNIVNQLQGLQKEQAAIPLQFEEQFTGRASVGQIQKMTDSELRRNSIKALGLAAIGQTLQGNIGLAEQSINKALEVEFEPQERRLETLKQLYTFNKDALDRQDRKKSEMLNIALNERARVLAEQKADKKYASELMIEAAKMGAPSDVLEQMKQSTPDGAIALGAKYFGAEWEAKAKQQAFENGIALRSMAAQEANVELARRKLLLDLAEKGDVNAIKELGYDPKNLPLTKEERAKFEDQQSLIKKDIKTVQGTLNNRIGLSTSAGLARGTTALTPLFINPAVGLYAKQKRNDFLSDAQYIINNLTFKKVKELSDAGIKLTPISEKELKLMGQASDVLVGGADFDEAGNLLGFKLSESRVREQLQNVLEHYQNAYDDITVSLLMSDEDQQAVINK